MVKDHNTPGRQGSHAANAAPSVYGQQGRGPLVTFIFALVILQGLTINLMPLLFGTIARTFEVNLRQQGQLQSFFLAGGLAALLVSGYVTEYVRAKRSGTLAIILIGSGSLLLGCSTTYGQVLIAAAVMGLGNMWILAAYSAVITAHFADIRQRMFMWATAAFAGSATISTTLFGYLLDVVPNWHLIFLSFAGISWIGYAAFFLVAGQRLRVLGQPAQSGDSMSFSESGGLAGRARTARTFLTAGLFNRGAFWILGILVVLDMLAAGNIVAWTARFFQKEYGVGDDQVGFMLSASAAGVFIGRLLMGAFVSGRFTDRTVLGTCYAAGILMYVLILLIPSYRVGLVLVFLNGAFIAAQAPTMYAIASAKFGDRAATAIPLMDAIGVLGGFMGPAAVGALADRHGLHAVLWLIPVVGFTLVLIVFGWHVVDRRKVRNTGVEA